MKRSYLFLFSILMLYLFLISCAGDVEFQDITPNVGRSSVTFHYFNKHNDTDLSHKTYKFGLEPNTSVQCYQDIANDWFVIQLYTTSSDPRENERIQYAVNQQLELVDLSLYERFLSFWGKDVQSFKQERMLDKDKYSALPANASEGVFFIFDSSHRPQNISQLDGDGAEGFIVLNEDPYFKEVFNIHGDNDCEFSGREQRGILDIYFECEELEDTQKQAKLTLQGWAECDLRGSTHYRSQLKTP